MKDLALIFFSSALRGGATRMYQLGSGFIATCGILQVFASFFEANLIYRYAWPSDGFGFRFFTLFCGLSLFIIMGIGADDIFVFAATLERELASQYSTIAHRMGHVFGHAGKGC